MEFMATKKGETAKTFPPSSLLLFLGPVSKIRDPGWGKNQDQSQR
jgi:hypothetical protein